MKSFVIDRDSGCFQTRAVPALAGTEAVTLFLYTNGSGSCHFHPATALDHTGPVPAPGILKRNPGQ